MKETCYDCGCPLTKENKSKDHIPPKAMFPESLRNDNLIKVPCCKACNNSHSEEDSYLLFLSGDMEAAFSAALIAHNVGEGLNSDGGHNLRKGFAQIRFGADNLSKSGEPYSETGIPIDCAAMFGRMAKGLMRHCRYGGNLQALTFHAQQANPADFEFVVERTKHAFKTIVKGHDVFRAHWVQNTTLPDDGMWWLQFYASSTILVRYHLIKQSNNCGFCRVLSGG